MPLTGCVEFNHRAEHACDYCGAARTFEQSRALPPTHPLVAWLVADSPRERGTAGTWHYERCRGCGCEGPVFVPACTNQHESARAAAA